MTDANTICHDVDLLGDWLDAKGFTEEAGLCLRVLGLIHEQAEENEKLRAALKAVVDDVLISREDLNLSLVSDDKLNAAAAALKETGDE